MKRTASKKIAGVTLLGRSGVRLPKSPCEAQLETFANAHPGRDYWIRLECPDFTSLCPVTGQPDFAEIVIDYVPGARCLETKALKLYLASYRNVPAFNEKVANSILDDLVAACAPRKMKLVAKFAPRGGLALSVTVEHPEEGAARSAP